MLVITNVMLISVFEATTYEDYLEAALSADGRRGRKAALARHLGCQTSYVSQVLTQRVHLSLEHAIRVSEFLEHSDDERRCFLLLVQKGKAGTSPLKEFFQGEIDSLRAQRREQRERIRAAQELSLDDQAMYYSGWWFAAVHVATLIPGVNSPAAIAKLLGLAPDLVDRTLDFLVSRGLVREKSGRYTEGSARINLPQRSPLVARHHANWRMKAIEVQERLHPKNVHVSNVFAISKKDGEKLRLMILGFVQSCEKMTGPSKGERAYAMLVDFFKLSAQAVERND